MNPGRSLLVILLSMIIAMSGALIAGCGDSEESTPDSENIQTIEVQRGTLTTSISAFGNVAMPHRANLSFGVGGTVQELRVEFGDMVKEGDVLANLDGESYRRSVERAEADLRIAEINLEKAGADISVTSARAAVESARVTLALAEEALEQARNFSVSDAETNLENARRDLATARSNAEINITDAEDLVEETYRTYTNFIEANIDKLENADVLEQKNALWWAYEKALENLEIIRETAQIAVTSAELRVTDAEYALNNAPIDVRQKESAVEEARAALVRAENELTNAEGGLDLELLEINVTKARIALDEARDQMEKTVLKAPFDGTIARVNVEIGDEVMGSTIVMILVDTSEVEIDADVDEIDVARLEIGQKAEIEIDAIQGTTLTGAVSAVSPVGFNQSGLITYDITIEINDPAVHNLRDGMTASADIEAIIAQNVILIPKAAITRDRAAGIQTVTVVADNGQSEVREVETGASNGKLTEITSGLTKGERIISSVNIAVSGGGGSADDAGSGSIDVMECLNKLQDLMPCFQKLMEMGEEMGMDPGEYGGEIPWDEIEYWAADETGEVPRDVKECLDNLLENRGCLEALMQMAEDMGIDTSSYSLDNMSGFGGMQYRP